MRSKIMDMKFMEIWCHSESPTGIAIFDNKKSDLMMIGAGALRELITFLLPGYKDEVYDSLKTLNVEDLQIIMNAVNADRERYTNGTGIKRAIRLVLKDSTTIQGVFKI